MTRLNYIKFIGASDILLQCFTWIAHLLNVSTGPFSFSLSLKKGGVRELPDDVIVDILSRLPAECVLDCQRVCKRWRSLTSSEHFIKLHLSRSTLAIFVHAMYYVRKGKPDLGFFVYDPTIAKRKKMKKLRLIKPEIVMDIGYTKLYDSCGGLLLFADRRNHCGFYVFNPVRQEQIVINYPSTGYLCGFYSHPPTNEYRILYVHRGYECIQYFVYTLGGSSSWRKIDSPPFDYAPSNVAPPAICNGALHWLTNWYYTNPEKVPPCDCGIIVFAIDTEDIVTMPHPGDDGTEHERMRLLASNEVLSFCLTSYYEKRIDIWTLEEYATWEWVRKWKVNLNLVLDLLDKNYLIEWLRVELIHIEDGQVWLECRGQGLFVYQLEHNRFTKLDGQALGDTESIRLNCTAFTRSVLCLHRLGSPLLE